MITAVIPLFFPPPSSLNPLPKCSERPRSNILIHAPTAVWLTLSGSTSQVVPEDVICWAELAELAALNNHPFPRPRRMTWKANLFNTFSRIHTSNGELSFGLLASFRDSTQARRLEARGLQYQEQERKTRSSRQHRRPLAVRRDRAVWDSPWLPPIAAVTCGVSLGGSFAVPPAARDSVPDQAPVLTRVVYQVLSCSPVRVIILSRRSEMQGDEGAEQLLKRSTGLPK